MTALTQRYAHQIEGILSCLDRVVITGTIPGICYAQGMQGYLSGRHIKFKDYPRFAEPLRDQVRTNIEQIAKQAGLSIEFIASKGAFRKEARIQEILAQRGCEPGLVHIFSAMELCPSFQYHYDPHTGKNSLRGRQGKCVHYYLYFVHEELGLCYLRVPTWAPFRLQFYFNGHNWLAQQLTKHGIAFQQMDNTFVQIQDWQRAQELADGLCIEALRQELDRLATLYCPVIEQFANGYHWSLMQVEYATDLVFRSAKDLAPLYDALIHTAIHAVKPDHVATFLGRKLHQNFEAELGSDFHTRIEGTRIKHHMGQAALKMYDKFGRVLRIETTANDVSFFQHYRTVEHRDGTKESKVAPMKKSIYSLPALQEVALASNRRYLCFLSDLSDPTPGVDKVERLAQPITHNERTYRGFNLFDGQDVALFQALLRGEFAISGFRNGTLRHILKHYTGPQVSRLIQRLHLHGLIRKVGRTYKYYLTALGQEVALAALKLRELVVIPTLAHLLPISPNSCATRA